MSTDPVVSPADTIRRHFAYFPGAGKAIEASRDAALAAVDAWEAERERDRQHIARLTEFVSAYDNLDGALDNLLDYLKIVRWSEPEDRNVKAALAWADRVAGYFGRCNAARAELADEEDAANGD